MKRKRVHIIWFALAAVCVSGLLSAAWSAQDVNLMTKETLKGILTEKDTIVLDVRTGRDWNSSEFKIQGAHRVDPQAFDKWSSTYAKDATIVLYCA
jgi:hypothetical protein